MKNINLSIVLLLFAVLSFSQKITRGPAIGEIYFLGPTHTGTGLYYSTDFGQTAVCVDSIKDLHNIEADKLQGCIYGMEITPALYFSNDFGNSGSWVYKTSGMYPELNSGVIEGYIYNNIESHSENYGSNFINHAANGFFGSLKASEMDNQIGTGYAVTKSSSIPDSVFLLISYDNFDNLSVINAIHEDTNIFKYLTRGKNDGELFTIRYRPFTFNPYEIYHCDDFGNEFTKMNELNMYNYFSFGVEGGREDGELFMIYNFVNLMWQNAHIYIYHSTDYGVTFEVFHPFAKGNEPVLANFSVPVKEVHLTNPVEFCNYSLGEVLEYHWDFNNDGTIDSYQEAPIHIFQDTGYYSVKLSVVGNDSTNSFLREDYIHVLDTTTQIIESYVNEISIYPNPVNNQCFIKLNKYNPNYWLSIYNLRGRKLKEIELKRKELLEIDFTNFSSGVYIINIKNQYESIYYKIIKN